MNILAKIGRWE